MTLCRVALCSILVLSPAGLLAQPSPSPTPTLAFEPAPLETGASHLSDSRLAP